VKDGNKTTSQSQRRIQRYLDDLERSNYTEAAGSAFHSGFPEDNDLADTGDGKSQGSLALATLKKRKNKADQSMAVRVLLMYRKNLSLLLEESVSPSSHILRKASLKCS